MQFDFKASNNKIEYKAIIVALKAYKVLSAGKLIIRSDFHYY